MRLIIAEKPSVARAISAELSKNPLFNNVGRAKSADGYLSLNNVVITWCFGHMLEQAEPDAYTSDQCPRTKAGKKVWRVQDLPILPQTWLLQPKKETKKQLLIIGKLLKSAKEIINAGDPDREGQLLIDQVLEHFGNRKPVKRFWVSAQDSISIQRGLASLKDNKSFFGWADAARARQRADWLIGMNLSRAYTLRSQRLGARALITVGRVQTPTLALVVARDREIESFKPKPYFTIEAIFKHEQGVFKGKWKPQEDQAGLDSEGRLIDPVIAESIINKINKQVGLIVDYKQRLKKLDHPTAFTLSDIRFVHLANMG